MYQRKSVKRILKAIRPQKSLKELNWLDVFVLTAILFGNAIYTSTMQWIASLSATEVVETGVQSYTAADDWWALVNQGKLFLFALVYLLIWNHDFKQLKVKLEWTVLLWGPRILSVLVRLVTWHLQTFLTFQGLLEGITI